MSGKSKIWDTLSTIIKSALWGALLLVCLKSMFSSLESIYENASLIKSPSITKKARETLVALFDLEREVEQAQRREWNRHTQELIREEISRHRVNDLSMGQKLKVALKRIALGRGVNIHSEKYAYWIERELLVEEALKRGIIAQVEYDALDLKKLQTTPEMAKSELERRSALTPEAARIEEERREAVNKFSQNPEEINAEINNIIREKCSGCGLAYNAPTDSKKTIEIHNELKKTISEVKINTSQDNIYLSNKKHSIELISSLLMLIFGFYLVYCLISFNKIGWKGISVNFLLVMPFMIFGFGNSTALLIYLFLVYPPIFALAKKTCFDLKKIY